MTTLKELAIEYKDVYLNADPFPHIVLDNFFLHEELKSIVEEFPDLSKEDTTSFNNSAERKLASNRGDFQQGNKTKQLLRYLNSHEFIDFLQTLTGIQEPLIPDPHFDGGGMHEIKPGGYLKIHADFCKHFETKLDRRINLLLYLNEDWEEEYGGHLELWNKDMTECRKRVLPIFNRMVIFNTTDYSYHGHPDPVTCPPSRSRKSFALYYYSNGRPSSELRPDDQWQSTLFVHRPGEEF